MAGGKRFRPEEETGIQPEETGGQPSEQEEKTPLRSRAGALPGGRKNGRR